MMRAVKTNHQAFPAPDASSYGVARLEGKMIAEFVEKPPKGAEPGNFVNAGAYVLEKKCLEHIPEGFNLIEKTLFPRLASGRLLFGHIHNGYWYTTDTPERLGAAQSGMQKAPKPSKQL